MRLGAGSRAVEAKVLPAEPSETRPMKAPPGARSIPPPKVLGRGCNDRPSVRSPNNPRVLISLEVSWPNNSAWSTAGKVNAIATIHWVLCMIVSPKPKDCRESPIAELYPGHQGTESTLVGRLRRGLTIRRRKSARPVHSWYPRQTGQAASGGIGRRERVGRVKMRMPPGGAGGGPPFPVSPASTESGHRRSLPVAPSPSSPHAPASNGPFARQPQPRSSGLLFGVSCGGSNGSPLDVLPGWSKD